MPLFFWRLQASEWLGRMTFGARPQGFASAGLTLLDRFAAARRILLAWQGSMRYSQTMRRFRTFLFLLLSIAVPLQGYAHFAQPAAHCPMEQAAMMDAAEGAAHDCCNDADPAGQACKSGQACQSVGSVLPVAGLGDLPHDLTPAVRFPRLADIAFSFDPAATWRPPSQL